MFMIFNYNFNEIPMMQYYIIIILYYYYLLLVPLIEFDAESNMIFDIYQYIILC